MSKRVWRWTVLVVAAMAVVPACGGSDDDSSDSADTDGSGGSGGTGNDGGQQVESAQCGSQLCEGLSSTFPAVPGADACCPNGEDDDACGLDTSGLASLGIELESGCQPVGAEGELDSACPASEPITVPDFDFEITLDGCCKPNGECGFMAQEFSGFVIGLGCVDAAEFGVEDPPSCTPSGSGSDGTASAGGAGGAS